MRQYEATISMIPRKAYNDAYNFEACLVDTGLTVQGPEPEYVLVKAMVDAGLPDGAIQFYRDETPSLRFSSILKAAAFWRKKYGRPR